MTSPKKVSWHLWRLRGAGSQIPVFFQKCIFGGIKGHFFKKFILYKNVLWPKIQFFSMSTIFFAASKKTNIFHHSQASFYTWLIFSPYKTKQWALQARSSRGSKRKWSNCFMCEFILKILLSLYTEVKKKWKYVSL